MLSYPFSNFDDKNRGGGKKNVQKFANIHLLTLFSWDTWFSLLTCVVVLPVFLFVLSVISTWISKLYHRIKATPDLTAEYYRMKRYKMLAVMLGLVYFTIVVSTVQMLGCKQGAFGKYYLNAYPFLLSFFIFYLFYYFREIRL